MWVTVLLMAVVVAISPSQIAGVVYILSRREPGQLLRDYFLGGFGISLIAGVVIVFGLGQVSAQTSTSTFAAWVETAVGALALVVAVLVGTGVSERLKERKEARRAGHGAPGKAKDGELSSAAKGPGHAKVPKRLQTALDGGSPWVAWVVGIGVGLPSPYYLAAIAAVLRSGAGSGRRIAALLLFNVVAFAVPEIALVGFRLAPEATRTRLSQTHEWADAHKRAIGAALAGIVGVYLTFRGIGQL